MEHNKEKEKNEMNVHLFYDILVNEYQQNQHQKKKKNEKI